MVEKNTGEQAKPAEDNNSPKGVQQKLADQKSDYVEAKKTRAKKKVENKLDLTGVKTVEQFTALYNEMVPTAIDLGIEKIEVRKEVFQMPDQGKRACERLHNLILKTRDSLASKATKETTVRKTVTKAGKKSARNAARGKRMSLSEDSKITWMGKDNPFREGSGRFKRTELVRTNSGKTVKTFTSHKGRTGTLIYCIKHGLAKVS